MTTTATSPRAAAARAFVRSLNILLKFARMYDFGHPRTAAQYETAWTELRLAIGPDDETGLLLSASGEQLLLDGVALESAQAEKSFARMLSTAGIASIHFSAKVTQASLARLVKAFPTGGAKPAALAAQLKAALEDDPGININEICFVPADSAIAKGQVAATIAARTLGMEADKYNELFQDPQKLLQLITAAEGSHSRGRGGRGDQGGGRNEQGGGGASGEFNVAPGTPGEAGPGLPMSQAPDFGLSWLASGNSAPADGSGGGGPRPLSDGGDAGGTREGLGRWASATWGLRSQSSGAGGGDVVMVETGMIGIQKEELESILKLLAQFARANDAEAKTDSTAFQSRIASLPRSARFTLAQALAGIAAQAPADRPDQPTLLRLAEHIAIRYALQSYERGDVQVNNIQQMLETMSREVEGLRKILGEHEEKMARAGMHVRPYSEMMAQQFWAEVTPEKRTEVLLSANAWCIPPQSVRESLDVLQKSGDAASVQSILENYAHCVQSAQPEARRAAALGLAELAPYYGDSDEKVLMGAIREAGLQLSEERDPEIQSVVAAAFVRLAQEAGQRKSYPAMQRAVEMMDYIEGERPSVAKTVRPRIAVEMRLAEFVDEAIKGGTIPMGLTAFLRRVPGPSAEVLAQRYSRLGFREDADLVLEAMRTLGPEGVTHLRETLHTAPPAQAVDTIAMLARVDLAALELLLPGRLKEWKRSAHDRVVRQLASSAAPERGRLILSVFESLDPLVQPLAIDEIGLAGEHQAESRLMQIADGELPPGATTFLQLKAIEALGRLRTPAAEKILRKIVEGKRVWSWTFPSELRIVAAQALERIDPDWAKNFLPKSGLGVAELALQPLDIDNSASVIRQRRYPRLKLERAVSAETINLKENYEFEIPEMNLGGGVALGDPRLHPGTVVSLKMNAGQKPLRAQAIVRDANTQARAFEVVDMDLDDRAKLRRLLVQIGNILKSTSPQNRGRNRSRTLLPTSTQQ